MIQDKIDPITGAIIQTVPNIPMVPPANAAALNPVFSPVAQEKAISMFGTNDQRQGSVAGYKQEVVNGLMPNPNTF